MKPFETGGADQHRRRHADEGQPGSPTSPTTRRSVPAESDADCRERDAGGDLVLTGVRKTYGPAAVLDVDRPWSCAGARSSCLVGENGAGKSTMMGVIAGVGATGRRHGRDRRSGARLDGGTLHAQELGVAMVSQEFPLVGQLSVAENLLLGRRPERAPRAASTGGRCTRPRGSMLAARRPRRPDCAAASTRCRSRSAS